MIEHWARNRENLGSNPGHGGLSLRVRAPRFLILAQNQTIMRWSIDTDSLVVLYVLTSIEPGNLAFMARMSCQKKKLGNRCVQPA